jgi:hypothetical protein
MMWTLEAFRVPARLSRADPEERRAVAEGIADVDALVCALTHSAGQRP